MSPEEIYRWRDESLEKSTQDSALSGPIVVADSWLTVDGSVRAVALHRARFLEAIAHTIPGQTAGVSDEAASFFTAALAMLPRHGAYFPRVEFRPRPDDAGHELVLRIREAPESSKSVVVASVPGGDPRTEPNVKGPDLELMAQVRSAAAEVGAGEAVVLTDEGYVVEGAYSALLWWRGNILCGPPAEFDRVNSVTARSVLALAAALGVETYEEAVTPAELEGTELWSLSALHGIRIVTRWVDGPALAELPGRLSTWRARLGALRQPL